MNNLNVAEPICASRPLDGLDSILDAKVMQVTNYICQRLKRDCCIIARDRAGHDGIAHGLILRRSENGWIIGGCVADHCATIEVKISVRVLAEFDYGPARYVRGRI